MLTIIVQNIRTRTVHKMTGGYAASSSTDCGVDAGPFDGYHIIPVGASVHANRCARCFR